MFKNFASEIVYSVRNTNNSPLKELLDVDDEMDGINNLAGEEMIVRSNLPTNLWLLFSMKEIGMATHGSWSEPTRAYGFTLKDGSNDIVLAYKDGQYLYGRSDVAVTIVPIKERRVLTWHEVVGTMMQEAINIDNDLINPNTAGTNRAQPLYGVIPATTEMQWYYPGVGIGCRAATTNMNSVLWVIPFLTFKFTDLGVERDNNGSVRVVLVGSSSARTRKLIAVCPATNRVANLKINDPRRLKRSARGRFLSPSMVDGYIPFKKKTDGLVPHISIVEMVSKAIESC